MSTLREILSKAHGVAAPSPLDGDELFPDYFIPRWRAWMMTPDKERRWSKEALEHLHQWGQGVYDRPRQGRFSPSAIGTDCERELIFAYQQAPQVPVSDPAKTSKMDSGTYEHLRHQMMGLSAGYMTKAEVWVHSIKLRCGGSADGQLDDRSLFELKNTASHLFDPITKGPDFLAGALKREANGDGSAAAYAAHMVLKHKLQMECYWYVDELAAEAEGRERYFTDYGSLVYQHEQTKRPYELRIKSSPSRRRQVEAIIDSANGWLDLNQLPDMLDGCALAIVGEASDKQKRRFQSCFYREHCPKAGSVLTAS